MKRHCTHQLCAHGMILICVGLGFAAQPVDPVSSTQQHPDVDNGKIVWQEVYTDGQTSDWDIYGIDLYAQPEPVTIYVAPYYYDQENPAIWNNYVVWQDNENGYWDLWMTDITDPANTVIYELASDGYDQVAPAIHGNTVTWQYHYGDDDWDIHAADITEPNNPAPYIVDEYLLNQSQPAIYRNTIVYSDDSGGDPNIFSADVWLRNAPQYQTVTFDDAALVQAAPAIWGNSVVYQQEEANGDMNIYIRDLSAPNADPVLIAGGTGSQEAPDISGNIVVWQDNRNGNWDIYGYNLVTKKEFQITTDTSDQTEPAVSGSLVVWTDARVNPTNIYYTWLDEVTAADCPVSPAGDTNGDCRVNLQDYVAAAQNWLACNLDPVSACN